MAPRIATAPSKSKSAAPTLKAVQTALRGQADPTKAVFHSRFFRTGPGEYGEGDVFLGLTVPRIRALAREFRAAPAPVRKALLASEYHEERLLALILMVKAYEKGDAETRKALAMDFLAQRGRVNNWDLVDSSAPNILGAWLLEEGGLKEKPRLLDELSRSVNLWDRRIAVLATFRFIRAGRFDWTLKLAERLLTDKEDLIHKAVGWMLREIGERDRAAEEGFLRRHCRTMPRTMLRYAIEKFPETRRKAYMRGDPPA
jgi:3-methyladenine DNA glycosylase AlkD